ncbi:AraC family transcriptional regulator [Oscillatoria sp. CS-180]|nr:AraC family transcriptional regulator [Oscillatoria sp. CS-180]MDB9527582.1 AraC family transcriptional regulator [Oscillatoria sp. CS-180]
MFECAIAEIALQCGFNSQSHFSKHFRDATGMTPSAYRKN